MILNDDHMEVVGSDEMITLVSSMPACIIDTKAAAARAASASMKYASYRHLIRNTLYAPRLHDRQFMKLDRYTNPNSTSMRSIALIPRNGAITPPNP
jgi:hypothetical protein